MQGIDNLVNDSFNLIGDKSTGVNLLEKLKYTLVDRLKFYELKNIENSLNKDITIDKGDINCTIKIENNKDNTSRIKKIINSDTLTIVLEGNITVSIHDKSPSKLENLQYISKNKGIVLAKNTIIDELITKDTILFIMTTDSKEKRLELN